MMAWFRNIRDKEQSGLPCLLKQWEMQTLTASEYSHCQKYSLALTHFQYAENIAIKACRLFPDNEEVLQYYALSSLNLAHVCHCKAMDQQTEQVLADAHFKMTEVMLDENKTLNMRQLAKRQAASILGNLSQFLNKAGRGQVADDLEEEFGRLSCIV